MQHRSDQGMSSKGAMPKQTIEAVAKSMYKQAISYGFNRDDIVRFVNEILDHAFKESGAFAVSPSKMQMGSSPEEFAIKGPKVHVRQARKDDLSLLEQWVEDPLGRLFLLSRVGGTDATLSDMFHSPANLFAVVELEEKPIGALAYLNHDKHHRVAELRKLIGEPEARGHGYAKLATQYWIEFGVTTLALRKIYLYTLDTNLANIQLNESMGFRVEGLLREECFVDGTYQDLLRMSLLIPQ
ncbi:GNAT family N-acetyltransferase [bacterium]|nr:GNAT family N-acetyltransferase [bacterium]